MKTRGSASTVGVQLGAPRCLSSNRRKSAERKSHRNVANTVEKGRARCCLKTSTSSWARSGLARNRIVFGEGSKAEQVCCLLSRADGATLSEIRTATDWQPIPCVGLFRALCGSRAGKCGASGKMERVYRLKS
jgi:Protein of unknown function (DUF3489)